MSKQATLEFDGKKYEFPVTVGTEGEIGIEIKKLRGEAGLITLDPGYKNTGSCESAITFFRRGTGNSSLQRVCYRRSRRKSRFSGSSLSFDFWGTSE